MACLNTYSVITVDQVILRHSICQYSTEYYVLCKYLQNPLRHPNGPQPQQLGRMQSVAGRAAGSVTTLMPYSDIDCLWQGTRGGHVVLTPVGERLGGPGLNKDIKLAAELQL